MNKQEIIKNSAICFLCKELHKETYAFGQEITKNLGLPVYYVIDSCITPSFVLEKDITSLIKITDKYSVKMGFQNCMITGQKINTILAKNPISYDKMLLHFCRKQLDVDFLLVFEDDVFIPSVDTIEHLITTYNQYDLVTPNNFYKDNEIWDWHWKSVLNTIDPPYYYSMVSAFGISRNLLNVIDDFVKKNNTLFFTEIMFNTLAMQNKLKVTDAFELKSVVWLGSWCIDDWLLLPNNVFHPMKELNNYESYRKAIVSGREKNLRPVNNLPSFIKDLM